MKDNGLTVLFFKKCRFALTLSGHCISGTEIRVDPKKNDAIVNFQHPVNKKQLQRWIGHLQLEAEIY